MKPPITVQLHVSQPSDLPDAPTQIDLAVVPAAEVELLRNRVDFLEKQVQYYEKRLDSLHQRLFELTVLFGDFRKGRL